MQRTWALMTPLVAAVLVVGMHLADAKPRVAVTPVEGDDSGDMRDAVADALDGEELDVIASGKVVKAIDKLGYEGELSEKQARKVAKELEADAVVSAKLGKSGSNKTLKFTVFVAGKKTRGFKVTFNNEKSEAFKTKLHDKIVGKVEAEVKPAPADDAGEPTAEGDDERPSKKKKKKRMAARDGDDDADAEIEAAVDRVRPRRSANRAAVRVDVGASFANRTLEFTQRANFPEGPKPYRNATVPGARIEGELYPLAFSKPSGFAAGLGIGAEYDRTLSLTLRTTDEPNVPVPTKQYHWSVGARIRIVFGKNPTSPSLTIRADYGKRAFSPDRSQLMDPDSLDVPTTAYTSFIPGLALRIPFVPQVALTAAGSALLPRDTGPIQRLDEYGRAKVFGIVAQAGVDIVLGNRFAIRLVGELTQIGFDFVGNGYNTTSLDNDPASKDIGGALDRSIGGAATLAVLY